MLSLFISESIYSGTSSSKERRKICMKTPGQVKDSPLALYVLSKHNYMD